jgi:hypothetical protein
VIWTHAPADPPGAGSSGAPRSPCIGDNPARGLLNNQATDRLTDDDLFEAGMAFWPWFLPESQSRCGRRRPRARGRSKDLEPCARRDRPRSRTALVQYFRFLLCGTSAAVIVAARRASRSKTANTFQLGAKDSAGIQMRGVNNGYARNRRPYNSFR